jgi:hypothetical protein
LDLIGYSEEEYGMKLFNGNTSQVLGYIELDYLGDALKEFATSPLSVRQFLDELFKLEAGEN